MRTSDIGGNNPVETVLVVDDDEAGVRLLERLLTSNGYAVTTAADGEGAFRRHRRTFCRAALFAAPGRGSEWWWRGTVAPRLRLGQRSVR